MVVTINKPLSPEVTDVLIETITSKRVLLMITGQIIVKKNNEIRAKENLNFEKKLVIYFLLSI